MLESDKVDFENSRLLFFTEGQIDATAFLQSTTDK